MCQSNILRLLGCFAAGLAFTGFARAQFVIEGVVDRQDPPYVDSVSFRIVPQLGFEYSAQLNGLPVPVGTFVEAGPDYYDLTVQAVNSDTGAVTNRLVRFIVRSSERQNSEWGLQPWVPYPVINSATAEFAGARLKIVTPQDYPLGLEVPVVAFVENETGQRAGVNGLITAAAIPGHSLQLRRGAGSAFLAPGTQAGPLSYQARIHSLQTNKQINLEPATTWTPIAGAISSETTWPENSRIHIISNITLNVGTTLTVGAGTVIKLSRGVEIGVSGTFAVNGTILRPVVFTPEDRSAPWGGIVCRTNTARLQFDGTIFTGSGANPNWFSQNPGSGSTHRGEQPLIYMRGARAILNDCYLIENQGQLGHGENAFLTMNRCLAQKAITVGQYNGGSVVMNDCALIEFPYDGAPFADDDNDIVYLTGGSHAFTNCLIGWALDDGLDSGSGSAGSVFVTRCWLESMFHEGMAWSETRLPQVRDTVAINCGQGIEAGFGSPNVFADHILSTGNQIGARFGDNYPWAYTGFLRVTNSLLLYNRKNVWGQTWTPGAWTNELDQMEIRGNYLTAPDTNHPNNLIWQPAVDGPRLLPFLTSRPGIVGVGIATRRKEFDRAALTNRIPVRLSTFSTNFVSVDYTVTASAAVLASGTLTFSPGQTVQHIALNIANARAYDAIQLTLSHPVAAEITGLDRLLFLDLELPPVASSVLIATGSVWKYLDTGTDLGTAWRGTNFNDTAWSSGRAELGYDEGDEATLIMGGPSNNRFRTTYFRRRFEVQNPASYATLLINLRRDDGGVVYINDREVFRSNMPGGAISFPTFAITSGTSESAFFSNSVSAAVLVSGTNLIAVEIHQASADSSDVSFELELTALPRPVVSVRRLGNELLFFWADATNVLEESDSVTGPWTGTSSGVTSLLVPVSGGQKFYRLRTP